MSTKIDKQAKIAIYQDFLKTNNKTLTASKFGCSARTVGRVVSEMVGDEVSSQHAVPVQPTQPVQEEPKKHYVCLLDEEMINITAITLDNSEPPVSEIAYKGSDEYEAAKKAYEDGRYADAFVAASKKEQLKSLSMGKVTVDVSTASLRYDDGVHSFNFPADLCDRILQIISKGDDATSLMMFANRLANNPSKRAVSELYGFLKASDIEIDADGLVICYKRIRDDYKDVYTGKIDNSVGQTVSMPRHMVNDDSSVTCSHGLHVCAKSYLNHYSGDRIVLCAVDPADFVSIPVDYDNAKARVSKYTVIAEVTDTLVY